MGDWKPWRSGKGYHSRDSPWTWWGNVFWSSSVKSILGKMLWSFCLDIILTVQRLDIRNIVLLEFHTSFDLNRKTSCRNLLKENVQPNRSSLPFSRQTSWFYYVYQVSLERLICRNTLSYVLVWNRKSENTFCCPFKDSRVFFFFGGGGGWV